MGILRIDKKAVGCYRFFSDPYWDGFIFGLLICLQAAGGSLLVYFCDGIPAQGWIGFFLVASLPVQVFIAKCDLRKKALATEHQAQHAEE